MNIQLRRRFLQPAAMSRKTMLNLTVHDSIVALLGIWLVYALQYAIQAVELGQQQSFYKRIIIGGVLTLVSLLIKVFRKPFVFTIFRDLRNSIDTICLPVLLGGDNNKYEAKGTGRIIALYGKGTLTWWEILIELFGDMFWFLILFSWFLYTVGDQEPMLLLRIAVLGVGIAVRFKRLGGKSRVWRKVAKEKMIELQRLQVKWFMSKFEIIQQDKVQEELQKRFAINEQWYQAKRKEKFMQGIIFDGAWFFATIVLVGIVWYVGSKVLAWDLLYSDVVALIGLGLIFSKDLENLLRRIRVLQDRWIDITKLRELLDEVENIVDIDAGAQFLPWIFTIQLSNIQYSYWWENIFSDFSLALSGGKKTALVWMSGSGKSTLVKLIAGYIHPLKGSISVDGQDLSTISLKSYYYHIGYLTQEPNVFDGTVRENLIYAASGDVNQERVDTVLKLAKCEFVYDLPNGLDTEIGERGVRLSGGQRQRLAIAKIMLKDPKLIILDEPTSALDSFSEEAITEAMHNLFQGRTVIIIAHRLQTVKAADDIIVLDKQSGEGAQVIERGTHEELVKKGGYYARMLEVQTGF